MAPKRLTSFRLSEEARRILAQLSEELGISQASVIEIAARDYARRREQDKRDGETSRT